LCNSSFSPLVLRTGDVFDQVFACIHKVFADRIYFLTGIFDLFDRCLVFYGSEIEVLV